MLLPICRLVDAPAEDAKILVDLNESEDSIFLDGDAKGEVLGAPDLSRGHEESTRTIKLGLVIDERNELVVSQVANAVQRDDVWLHWQRNNYSAPVWFKLIGVPGGGLNMDLVLLEGEGFYEWSLTLLAEGFAYGPRVSEPVQLQYRHFEGGTDTDVLSARLSEVKGDAPTRARVDVRPNGWMRGWSPWVNVTAVPDGSTWGGPTIWQAEAFTPATGYQRAEVTWGGPEPTSGNPYNVLMVRGTQSTQFAGARCLSGLTPTVPPPGRYVMMIRLIASSGEPCEPSFRWGVIAGPQEMLGTWSTWRKPVKYEPSINFSSWLNLGAFQLPAGMNTDGIKDGEAAAPTLTLWHRGDGSGVDVAVDKILLMPAELAEGATSNVQANAPFETWGSTVDQMLRFDDSAHRVGIMTKDATPRWVTNVPPKTTGQLPVVTPGLENVVTLLPNVGTTGGTDSAFASKFEVDVSYHPRYLHLAGA